MSFFPFIIDTRSLSISPTHAHIYATQSWTINQSIYSSVCLCPSLSIKGYFLAISFLSVGSPATRESVDSISVLCDWPVTSASLPANRCYVSESRGEGQSSLLSALAPRALLTFAQNISLFASSPLDKRVHQHQPWRVVKWSNFRLYYFRKKIQTLLLLGLYTFRCLATNCTC